MNIDRAIKNLKAGREDCGMIPSEEFTPTIDLAIAGLERIKVQRMGAPGTGLLQTTLLPGETKE